LTFTLLYHQTDAIGLLQTRATAASAFRPPMNCSSISDPSTLATQFPTRCSTLHLHQQTPCCRPSHVLTRHHRSVHCRVPDIIRTAKAVCWHHRPPSQDSCRRTRHWRNTFHPTDSIREWDHLICIPRILTIHVNNYLLSLSLSLSLPLYSLTHSR